MRSSILFLATLSSFSSAIPISGPFQADTVSTIPDSESKLPLWQQPARSSYLPSRRSTPWFTVPTLKRSPTPGRDSLFAHAATRPREDSPPPLADPSAGIKLGTPSPKNRKPAISQPPVLSGPSNMPPPTPAQGSSSLAPPKGEDAELQRLPESQHQQESGGTTPGPPEPWKEGGGAQGVRMTFTDPHGQNIEDPKKAQGTGRSGMGDRRDPWDPKR